MYVKNHIISVLNGRYVRRYLFIFLFGTLMKRWSVAQLMCGWMPQVVPGFSKEASTGTGCTRARHKANSKAGVLSTKLTETSAVLAGSTSAFSRRWTRTVSRCKAKLILYCTLHACTYLVSCSVRRNIHGQNGLSWIFDFKTIVIDENVCIAIIFGTGFKPYLWSI